MGRNVNCIVEIQKDSKFAVSISKKKTKKKKKQVGSTNATRRFKTKKRSQ
jgi:hypothetical protein